MAEPVTPVYCKCSQQYKVLLSVYKYHYFTQLKRVKMSFTKQRDGCPLMNVFEAMISFQCHTLVN